jgi:hypothetical protein
MLPRVDHVGCSLDDLPKRAVGAFVVDAANLVPALFLEHAEADEPTEFFCRGSLQDHLTGWLGLVETWLVMPDYPKGQRQSARSPEEFLAYLVRVQRRVPESD